MHVEIYNEVEVVRDAFFDAFHNDIKYSCWEKLVNLKTFQMK